MSHKGHTFRKKERRNLSEPLVVSLFIKPSVMSVALGRAGSRVQLLIDRVTDALAQPREGRAAFGLGTLGTLRALPVDRLAVLVAVRVVADVVHVGPFSRFVVVARRSAANLCHAVTGHLREMSNIHPERRGLKIHPKEIAVQ